MKASKKRVREKLKILQIKRLKTKKSRETNQKENKQKNNISKWINQNNEANLAANKNIIKFKRVNNKKQNKKKLKKLQKVENELHRYPQLVITIKKTKNELKEQEING